MQKTQGIYKITNLINNKCYIGQSRNIESRIKKHFSNLEKNIHHSQYLQEDFNKYGKENFSIEILETINDLDLLLIVEDFYIKKFHAYGCGYNMTPSKLEKENTYGLNMSINKIEEILQQSDYIIFNDTLLKDSDSLIPYKFIIKYDDNKYKVTDFIAPRDGEDTYYKDLKNIFPKSVLKNINNIYSDGTSDKLEMEIMEDVKLYFHK